MLLFAPMCARADPQLGHETPTTEMCLDRSALMEKATRAKLPRVRTSQEQLFGVVVFARLRATSPVLLCRLSNVQVQANTSRL